MARTSTPAYSTVHMWLHKDRGPASEYICAYHGDHYAETWVYNLLGGDNERTGTSYSRGRYAYEYSYSVDTNDYYPLCRKAHNELDALHRNAENTINGDEDETGMWLM